MNTQSVYITTNIVLFLFSQLEMRTNLVCAQTLH